MSAYIDGLKARRDQIVSELADIQLNNGKPGSKPNLTNTDGGTALDHVGYKDGLYRELKEIDALLINAANVDAALDGASDPFAFETTIIN